MKKILVAVAVSVLAATSAFAASDIRNTKHNLQTGTANSIQADTDTEICVFCHTPHNSAIKVPLWNRSNNVIAAYTFYSSATLTPAAKGAALTSANYSMMCLSCHDGSVAQIGSRVTNAGTAGSIPTTSSSAGGNGWTNGGIVADSDNLSNDHPIGFNYDTAQLADSELRTNATAVAAGVKFYGAGADMIECSSCHVVHDNTLVPFLRVNNEGSNLCLACHAK